MHMIGFSSITTACVCATTMTMLASGWQDTALQPEHQCSTLPNTCNISALPTAEFAFTQPWQDTVHVQIHIVLRCRVGGYQQIYMISPALLLKHVQQVRHFFLHERHYFPKAGKATLCKQVQAYMHCLQVAMSWACGQSEEIFWRTSHNWSFLKCQAWVRHVSIFKTKPTSQACKHPNSKQDK